LDIFLAIPVVLFTTYEMKSGKNASNLEGQEAIAT